MIDLLILAIVGVGLLYSCDIFPTTWKLWKHSWTLATVYRECVVVKTYTFSSYAACWLKLCLIIWMW